MPAKDKLYKIETISSSFDAFFYEVPLEKQDWEILEDTKVIGGYTCQLAKTHFKGRDYEAWFTGELPFYFGPWKLHGLPGLILSAQDSKGEVKFEYVGFDKVEGEELVIEIPYYVIKSSKEEINKLRDVFKNDQGKYYESLRNSGRFDLGSQFYGIDYTKHQIDMKFDETYQPSHQTNNPIEK